MPVKRIPGPGKDTLKKIADLAHLGAEVGWFASSKYEDGTPVAYVAAINEFGYAGGGIPARSFMRSTVNEKQADWNSTVAKLLKSQAAATNIMEIIGAMCAGDIRAKIATITEPALSERTKAARRRRGNSSVKPLVDTRILMPTLNHQIKQI